MSTHYAVEHAVQHAEDGILALKGRTNLSPKQMAEARILFLRAAKILGFSEQLVRLGVYAVSPEPYQGEQLRTTDGTPLLRTAKERETNYRSAQLGALHHLILDALKKHGPIRAVDLDDHLPNTPNPKHLHVCLETLVDGGWILREGHTKATTYRLAPDEQPAAAVK